MSKTAKIILFLFGAFIVICIFSLAYKSLYSELFLSYECRNKLKAEEVEFNGVIKKKFIDTENHSTKALVIRNNNLTITLHFPDPNLFRVWDESKVNDSIKKNTNSLVYYLRNSTKKDTLIIKYKCP